MSLVLYLLTVALGLLLARRWGRLSLRAALFLALLPLVITGGAVSLGRVFGPADGPYFTEPLKGYAAAYPIGDHHVGLLFDLWDQIIPWRAAVRFAFAHGEWPLWNPFILCGDVLAGAAQPAPYHPLALLGLLLPLATSLGYLAGCTLFLAALGTFGFSRSLGVGENGSLLAAAGFALCDFETFWVGWPMGLAAAGLPLVLLGVRALVAGRSRGGLLVVAVSLVILAGHPETLAHVMLAGALWGVLELSSLAGWHLRLAMAARAAGACLLAALLCAVFLLPVLDAMEQSVELRQRSAGGSVSPAAPWAEAVDVGVWHLLPFEYGLPGAVERKDKPPALEAGAYAGSLLLPLFCVGSIWGRGRERFWLAGLALWAGLVAAGWPGVTHLLHLLPPFGLALNRRLAFVAALGLAVVAGLGLDALEGRLLPRRAGAATLVVAFLGCGLLLAAYGPAMIAGGLPPAFLVPRAAVWLAAPGLALLAVLLLRDRRPAVLATLLVALLVTQRWVERGGFYPTLPVSTFFPRVPPVEAAAGGEGPYRVVAKGFGLIPNTATLWGLEDPRGYQALHLPRGREVAGLWSVEQGAWFNRVDDLARPFLSFLNVRYAFTSPAARVPAGWQVVGRFPEVNLLENPRALGRAFVPPRVRLGGAPDRVLREMGEEPDFRARAWVDDPDEPDEPDAEPRGQANGPGEIRALQRRGTGLEFEAQMQGRGWVIVSETAWRGWRAWVDGESAPLRFGNHAFLALHLSPGSHRVRLAFRPTSFVVGRWLSAVAGLALAVALWRRRHRPTSALW